MSETKTQKMGIDDAISLAQAAIDGDMAAVYGYSAGEVAEWRAKNINSVKTLVAAVDVGPDLRVEVYRTVKG